MFSEISLSAFGKPSCCCLVDNSASNSSEGTEISTKINKLKKVVSNYEQEVKDIFGKVPRLRLMSQVNKLDNFIPALGKLMLDNGYVYDKTEDRDLIFGISSDYKPKYMLLNNGDCYKPLDDSFSNFAKSPA